MRAKMIENEFKSYYAYKVFNAVKTRIEKWNKLDAIHDTKK